MNSPDDNPPVSRLLRWVTGLEAWVVFFAGAGLFFLPQLVSPLWPWSLSPFNAFLLGTIYLTSWIATMMLIFNPRWSPSRLIIPMIFLFTTIVLVVSIFYLDRFTPNSPSTVLWFVLYIGIPINCAYHLWVYRERRPSQAQPTPAWLKRILIAHAVFLGGYGLGLLIAPALFGGFWPWGVDDFHGRMYSVGILTPVLGELLLAHMGSRLEFLTLGGTQILGGASAIIGLFLVDSNLHRVDWSQAGTWFWIVLLGSLVIVGVTIIIVNRQAKRLSPV